MPFVTLELYFELLIPASLAVIALSTCQEISNSKSGSGIDAL